MSLHFFARTSVLALPLVLLPLLAVPACTKSSSSGAAESCPYAWYDGGFGSFESAASGSIKGTGASASFCNVGVFLQPIEGSATPTFVWNLDTSTLATSSSVQLPAGGVDAALSGGLQIHSDKPGVYKSTDATTCGSFTFTYGVPTDGGADCATADASFGQCPSGCSQSFQCPSSPPCCLPLATTYVFQATSGVSCANVIGVALGSWTLTLTSVSAADAGVNGAGLVYVTHGTLEGTLQGTTTGSTEPLTLSLTF